MVAGLRDEPVFGLFSAATAASGTSDEAGAS